MHNQVISTKIFNDYAETREPAVITPARTVKVKTVHERSYGAGGFFQMARSMKNEIKANKSNIRYRQEPQIGEIARMNYSSNRTYKKYLEMQKTQKANEA